MPSQCRRFSGAGDNLELLELTENHRCDHSIELMMTPII